MKAKNELTCIQAVSNSATPEELPFIFVTEFDDAAVSSFYKSFMTMLAKPEIKIIPIVISSYGGEVYALLSMLDVMECATKPVATIALGKAMSCGSVLLAAGTRGHRYLAPNADVLIHQVSNFSWGKLDKMKHDVEQTERLNQKLFQLMEKYTGAKKGFYSKQMKAKGNLDWYIEANQCKKLNIIDEIGVPALVKR